MTIGSALSGRVPLAEALELVQHEIELDLIVAA
jgi:hypothetical protein